MNGPMPLVILAFEGHDGLVRQEHPIPLLAFADTAGIPDDQEPDEEAATRVANSGLRSLEGHWICVSAAEEPAITLEGGLVCPKAWRFVFRLERKDGE